MFMPDEVLQPRLLLHMNAAMLCNTLQLSNGLPYEASLYQPCNLAAVLFNGCC